LTKNFKFGGRVGFALGATAFNPESPELQPCR
jgi:hypothetical protein